MNKGIVYGAASYALWGFFPIYFKFLQAVPAVQIVMHRIVWSFILLLAMVVLRREVRELKAALKGRTLLIYLAAGLLLAVNWLTYIWAINAGFIVEASLGYFINPLVSVLLGVIFLGERLRPIQWLPVVLATAGVLYLTISLGSLPWIALVLAFSFGLYGLVKKVAPLGSLHGLTLETGVILLPALGYLAFAEIGGTGFFGHASLATNLLLIFSGVVTAAPLLLFAAGTRSVPLSTMGLLQYIAPTLQFIIGIMLYNEPFNQHQLLGFIMIWAALIIFSVESLVVYRRAPAPTV